MSAIVFAGQVEWNRPEGKKIGNIEGYVQTDHNSCLETDLYPLSPFSMSLYYAFLPEIEIE